MANEPRTGGVAFCCVCDEELPGYWYGGVFYCREHAPAVTARPSEPITRRMTDDEYRAANTRHWMDVAQIEHQRVLELEAEVERLRADYARLNKSYGGVCEQNEQFYAIIKEQEAQIAAMRPVVEAVASHEGFDRYPDDIDYPATCAFCNETDDNEMTQIEHLDWCPVTQAQVYVAQYPTAAAAEQ